MAGMKLITKPTVEPLLLPDVKVQLRIDAEDGCDDPMLTRMIAVARMMAEKYTARAFIQQGWRQYFDGFPGCVLVGHIFSGGFRPHERHNHVRYFELMRSPTISVDAVKYLDPQGQEQTLDPSLYVVSLDPDPATIRLAIGQSWPQCLRVENSVWVEFTAGYGETADDVLLTDKQAMLMLINHWYVFGEPVQGVEGKELPFTVSALLDMEKVWYS